MCHELREKESKSSKAKAKVVIRNLDEINEEGRWENDKNLVPGPGQ